MRKAVCNKYIKAGDIFMATPGFKEKNTILPVRTEDPINELHQTEKRHMAIVKIETPQGMFFRQVYEGGEVKIRLPNGDQVTVYAKEIYNGYRGNTLGANLRLKMTGINPIEGIVGIGYQLYPAGNSGLRVRLMDVSEPQSREVVSHAILRIIDQNQSNMVLIARPGLDDTKTIRLPNGDTLDITVLRTFAGVTFGANFAEMHTIQKRGSQVVQDRMQILRAGEGINIQGTAIVLNDLSEPTGAEEKYGAIFQAANAAGVLGLTKIMPGQSKDVGGQRISVVQVAPARTTAGNSAAIEVRAGGNIYTQYLNTGQGLLIGGNSYTVADIAKEY